MQDAYTPYLIMIGLAYVKMLQHPDNKKDYQAIIDCLMKEMKKI